MSNTKEKIIYLADELIRGRGYNAFSYYDISKTIGIKNAAIHYHFPTKTDLAVAVVEDHIKRFWEFTIQVESKKSIEKIKSYLNLFSQIQTENKLPLISSLSSDWETLEPSVQQALKKHLEDNINWLVNVLEEGKKNGNFVFKNSAETKAFQIITNMQSATQLSRISGSDGFQLLKFAIINDLINQ
jgi:TetR/AcrR family transcriptional regulator, transcriptional repressor for nem operon